MCVWLHTLLVPRLGCPRMGMDTGLWSILRGLAREDIMKAQGLSVRASPSPYIGDECALGMFVLALSECLIKSYLEEPLSTPFASFSVTVPRGLTSGGLGWGDSEGMRCQGGELWR